MLEEEEEEEEEEREKQDIKCSGCKAGKGLGQRLGVQLWRLNTLLRAFLRLGTGTSRARRAMILFKVSCLALLIAATLCPHGRTSVYIYRERARARARARARVREKDRASQGV